MAQTLQRIYSDIDLTFRKTPGKNDISISYDEMAVVRSIRHLLLTKKYERPFDSGIYSGVETMLFEPISPLTANVLKVEVQNVIERLEPRAKIDLITIDPDYDNNAYSVFLQFYVGNNTQPTAINLLLERTR